MTFSHLGWVKKANLNQVWESRICSYITSFGQALPDYAIAVLL
jgi:hypothetical protein